MRTEEFEKLTRELMDRCVEVQSRKADEYATADRLHNFKIAAKLQGCTTMTALAGMMAKHTVSIYDLIDWSAKGKSIDEDVWIEKIVDHINYLTLLWAIVTEEMEGINK